MLIRSPEVVQQENDDTQKPFSIYVIVVCGWKKDEKMNEGFLKFIIDYIGALVYICGVGRII